MDHATSETLTRTGAGTAMGKLMRRYWVPILGSAEIAEPDGPQVRVQIMGEKLLAFRDTEGKPGLIGEFCAHRGVSRRPRANRDNDYLIDRRAQKEKRAYSGVFGISEQDASLQESMGAIQDRTRELLLPTDKAIQMARRMLHEAALGLLEGREPPALDASSQQVRAAGVLLPRDQDPKPWGKDKIEHVQGKPVYSL